MENLTSYQITNILLTVRKIRHWIMITPQYMFLSKIFVVYHNFTTQINLEILSDLWMGLIVTECFICTYQLVLMVKLLTLKYLFLVIFNYLLIIKEYKCLKYFIFHFLKNYSILISYLRFAYIFKIL